LAVAAEIGNRAEMLWAGDQEGMEFHLVQRRGIPFKHVPAAGFHGVGIRSLPGNIRRMSNGYLAARKTVDSFQPNAILLTGGYPGVPIALARAGTPLMLYVPDIEPGSAARLISRWADQIMVTTEDSLGYYPDPDRVKIVGYPVRSWLRRLPKDQARAHFGMNPEEGVVLIFGGSRGARSINRAVWVALQRLLSSTQLIHITGELDWPEGQAVGEQLEPALKNRYAVFPYLHEEMGVAFSAADLVVSRAGAAVLGEYASFALPSLLVPYPHAWRYQSVNAEFLVHRGSALQIDDSELDHTLAPLIVELLQDPERLANMSAAAAQLAEANAAKKIADELMLLASSSPPDTASGTTTGTGNGLPGETRVTGG
jgi:UDP-N-acetylglucosamine--N-acetylmuramyl-(pentapeptide) pyrophosphoryl-undecaprenol N-acetylglucosamine transferase